MAAVFGGLQSDRYDRQYADLDLLKRITVYALRHRLAVVLILAGFLLVGAMRALRPVLISAGVDELVVAGDRLNVLLLLLAFVAISEYISNYIRRRFAVVVIGRIVAEMRKHAFDAAIERDLAFYDRHKSGAVMSRITSDTQEFGDVMLLGSEVVSQFLTVIVLFLALLSYSLELSFILLLTMPLVVCASLIFRYMARIVTRQGARAMAVVNDNIQESVTGISIAKNFRQEAMIYKEFSAVNVLSYVINLRRGFVMSLVFPTMGVLVRYRAGHCHVDRNAHSSSAGRSAQAPGSLFIQGVDRFWFPFMNLASFWSQFQQGLSAAERIFALIDADNEVVQTDSAAISPLQGRVQFRKCGLPAMTAAMLCCATSASTLSRARTWLSWGIPAPARAPSPS